MKSLTYQKNRGLGGGGEGFTLIETVLAIGIVATVMVALLGLLPSGMQIMSEAGSNTVGARIANKLVGQLQLAEFEEIQQYHGKEFHFDDMGTEVKKQDEASKQRIIYTARIEIEEGNPELPGTQPNQFLKRVVVKVSAVLGREPVFDDPDPSVDRERRKKKDYKSYWTFVIDTEKED